MQAPAKAGQAVVRFLGTGGEGQAWVDEISLRRVPEAQALPAADDATDALEALPPLPVGQALAGPLRVDFAAPLPAAVSAMDHPVQDGRLVVAEGYIALRLTWPFRSAHDLEFRVQAAGRDGATLGALVIEEAPAAGHRWVRVGKHSFSPFARPLTENAGVFTYRYPHRQTVRRVQLLLYRASQKGTLVLSGLEAVPVLPAAASPAAPAKAPGE